MTEVEILLHYGLYKAVQESYEDWSCEIKTNRNGDCINVHLMLKSDNVLASIGKYRIGVNTDDFYKQMIGELK